MNPWVERREVFSSPEVIRPSPVVTVVVRAHNEEDNILDTLESLEKQTLSLGKFRVIVVNNASEDKTKELAEDFLRTHPNFPGRLVDEPGIGPAKALQRGFLEAETEYVACLDGDSIALENWLEALVGYMEACPEVVAVSGRNRFKDGRLHHRVLYRLAREAVFKAAAKTDQGWISGANCCVRKSAFFAVGGVEGCDQNTLDDRVLSVRLRRVGKVGFEPEAEVVTANWLTEDKTWVSGLSFELDKVQEALGGEESLFHKSVRPVSETCQRWDRIKKEIGNKNLAFAFCW